MITTTTYPCPTCAGTFLPGVVYSSTTTVDLSNQPSCGKVYVPSPNWNGSGYIGECHRCKGTGLVAERRSAGERRRVAQRRRPLPPDPED